MGPHGSPNADQRDYEHGKTANLGPNAGSYKGKKGKDLFIAMMKDSNFTPFKEGKPVVESYTSQGNNGSVIVRNPNGKTETILCVKEDGRWRLQNTGIK